MEQQSYIDKLYKEHNLNPASDPEVVEKTITSLLENPETMIAAMELGLGRRVDAKELKNNQTGFIEFIINPLIDPQERYAYMLMQKTMESFDSLIMLTNND